MGEPVAGWTQDAARNRSRLDRFARLRRETSGGSTLWPGRPELPRAIGTLKVRYPRLCVAGIADGFFRVRSEEETIHDIVATTPHVVLVGVGSPRQEKWLAAHRHRFPAPVCWTVGAFFDYLAGAERRAPVWMRRLALEWCWRLFVDPRGK